MRAVSRNEISRPRGWLEMLKESNRIPSVVPVSLGSGRRLLLPSCARVAPLNRELIAKPGGHDSRYNGFLASYTSLSTGRPASLIDEDVVRAFFHNFTARERALPVGVCSGQRSFPSSWPARRAASRDPISFRRCSLVSLDGVSCNYATSP